MDTGYKKFSAALARLCKDTGIAATDGDIYRATVDAMGRDEDTISRLMRALAIVGHGIDCVDHESSVCCDMVTIDTRNAFRGGLDVPECSMCGSKDESVDLRVDPYSAEICDCHDKRWLCDDCVSQRAGDI
jgi:hypothetical protein